MLGVVPSNQLDHNLWDSIEAKKFALGVGADDMDIKGLKTLKLINRISGMII